MACENCDYDILSDFCRNLNLFLPDVNKFPRNID